MAFVYVKLSYFHIDIKMYINESYTYAKMLS